MLPSAPVLGDHAYPGERCRAAVAQLQVPANIDRRCQIV